MNHKISRNLKKYLDPYSSWTTGIFLSSMGGEAASFIRSSNPLWQAFIIYRSAYGVRDGLYYLKDDYYTQSINVQLKYSPVIKELLP